MNFARVFLKKGEDQNIRQGFLWVFENEIFRVKFFAEGFWKETTFSKLQDEKEGGGIADGSVAEIFSFEGGFLGSGVFNSKSKIAVRIISAQHAEKIFSEEEKNSKRDFVFKRICDAYNLRRIHFSDSDSFRIFFSEADFLPGLVAERYVEEGRVFLLVQFLALAAEIFRSEVIWALEKICKPFAIYERSDAQVRLKEGLPLKTGWIKNPAISAEKITIEENGLRFLVDLVAGQKTGFFLDQKFNRAAISRYCRGKKILDAFCHTGAFGLNAFKAGAKSVLCADISADAISLAQKNVELNGAGDVVKTECRDVFELLRECEAEGKKFDVVILDPPAFAKNAASSKKAFGGYKEINLRAMRILSAGGILVTCSCSHFFSEEQFCSMLKKAASDSHKKVQILQKRGAAPDHPVLLGYDRSEYLSCFVCRVL